MVIFSPAPRRRRMRGVVGALLALALLAGCGGSGSEEDVRKAAQTSVEQALSAVRTGGYGAQQAAEGAALRPYLAVLTDEAATTADSANAAFVVAAAAARGAAPPPTPESARLDEEVSRLLVAATEELGAAHRAVQQAGLPGLATHREALDRVGRGLEELQGRLG